MESKIISVAGFKIKLQAEDIANIALEQAYEHFIIPDIFLKEDVLIKSFIGIPDNLLSHDNIIFEAKDQQQKYFSIHQFEQSYKFIIYNQQSINQVQQIAVLNKDFSEWIIYSNSIKNNNITFPLLYPMGPLVLYYLTVKYNAIMIHASGVFDGENGRIFTGFSGVGKSTMANLWLQSGCEIINDDRLFIRNQNGKYFMYNTPMFYSDLPKKSPLNAIYLIKHANTNTIQKISGVSAVSQLMAFCIQHDFNKSFIEHHLNFLSHLCNKIPVCKIGFLPDKHIIDYIKIHAV